MNVDRLPCITSLRKTSQNQSRHIVLAFPQLYRPLWPRPLHPPFQIHQSAPFSVSPPSSTAPEPVGQNHLPATKGGTARHAPTEQWIFFQHFPVSGLKPCASHGLNASTLSRCQSETCHSTHKLSYIPCGATHCHFANIPQRSRFCLSSL